MTNEVENESNDPTLINAFFRRIFIQQYNQFFPILCNETFWSVHERVVDLKQ